MRLGVIVLVAACAACGRIGFDTTSDGGSGGGDDAVDAAPLADAPPGVLRVIVTTPAGSMEPGEPLPGVSVLYEDATGATELEITDSNGVVELEVQGTMAVHVFTPKVANVAPQWRVTSVLEIGGGSTIHIGSDGTTDAQIGLDAVVPMHATANLYNIVGPAHCIVEGTSTTTMIPTAFRKQCDGEVHDLYAVASMDETLLGWQRTPNVTFAQAANVTFAGGWQALVERTLMYTNLPNGLDLTTHYYASSGSQMTRLGTGDAVVAGTTVTTAPTINVPPMLVESNATLGASFFQILISSYPLAGGAIDADDFIAGFSGLNAQQAKPNLTWAVAPMGVAPLLVGVSSTYSRPDAVDVEWIVYAPVSETERSFPAVPPSLAAIAPITGTTWQPAGGVAIKTVGTAYATAIETIDQLLLQPSRTLFVNPGFGLTALRNGGTSVARTWAFAESPWLQRAISRDRSSRSTSTPSHRADEPRPRATATARPGSTARAR